MNEFKNGLIITRIIGGLGNQLFQFAFGHHLSRILGARHQTDFSGFDSYALREPLLRKLNVPIEECNPKSLRPIAMLGSGRYQRAAMKRLIGLSERFGGRYHYLRDTSYFNALKKIRCGDWTYLDGYWQFHAHLADIRSDLLNFFTPRDFVATPKLSTATVGVHFRRGDYVTDPNTVKLLGTVSNSYYADAFRLLKSELGPALVPVIFSDDPKWVMANVNLDPNQIVQNSSDPISDFMQLRSCDHQIIANSTFSWWAAWLNENPLKKVVAPRRWFAGREFEIKNLIPEDWVTL